MKVEAITACTNSRKLYLVSKLRKPPHGFTPSLFASGEPVLRTKVLSPALNSKANARQVQVSLRIPYDFLHDDIFRVSYQRVLLLTQIVLHHVQLENAGFKLVSEFRKHRRDLLVFEFLELGNDVVALLCRPSSSRQNLPAGSSEDEGG